jgi:membrane-bound metal-dependent hydrolase YbcI (DUF457 family)
MFVGHYSASLVAKRIAPELPLWVLLLAAQAVDIGWALLVLAGVEHVRIVPGHTAANPLDLYHMPYTHSLPAVLLWALGAALLTFAWARRTRSPAAAPRLATVLGAVVFSHWLLDLVVHVPDLPLWADSYKVGLGLWNHVVAATLLELALLAGAALWLRADRAAWQRAGGRTLGIFVGVLVVFHAVNLYAPPPPSVMAVCIAGLSIYLVVAAVGAWLERRAAARTS